MPRTPIAKVAVRVMKSGGVEVAFGIPGAAILPLCDAMRHTMIKHVLVRHGALG